MAVDYSAIAENALQALSEAGSVMVLAVPGESTYDPTTATATATPAEHSCTGVLLPPGSMTGSGFTFGPDVLVRAQALAFVGASGLTARPAPGCVLTIGADRWLVIGSDTLAPAGVSVLHAMALIAAPAETSQTHEAALALEGGDLLLLESGDLLLLE